jgi:hypothetical protein
VTPQPAAREVWFGGVAPHVPLASHTKGFAQSFTLSQRVLQRFVESHSKGEQSVALLPSALRIVWSPSHRAVGAQEPSTQA